MENLYRPLRWIHILPWRVDFWDMHWRWTGCIAARNWREFWGLTGMWFKCGLRQWRIEVELTPAGPGIKTNDGGVYLPPAK